MPTPKKNPGGATTRKSAAAEAAKASPAATQAAQRKQTDINTGRSANVGGVPAAASTASNEQVTSEARLVRQREAAEQRTQAAAERRGGSFPTSGVYTAVCKNGLSHRRNGIIFGAEPVTIDTANWTEEEKQRFFNDSLLMIVGGVQLGARGATLAPGASFPATLTGGAGENATPAMLKALEQGTAMPHPSAGSATAVVGASSPHAARDLERLINADDNGDDDGGTE